MEDVSWPLQPMLLLMDIFTASLTSLNCSRRRVATVICPSKLHWRKVKCNKNKRLWRKQQQQQQPMMIAQSQSQRRRQQQQQWKLNKLMMITLSKSTRLIDGTLIFASGGLHLCLWVKLIFLATNRTTPFGTFWSSWFIGLCGFVSFGKIPAKGLLQYYVFHNLQTISRLSLSVLWGMYMTFSSQSACMHATIISDVFHSLYSETDIRVEKEDFIVWMDYNSNLFCIQLSSYTLPN